MGVQSGAKSKEIHHAACGTCQPLRTKGANAQYPAWAGAAVH